MQFTHKIKMFNSPVKNEVNIPLSLIKKFKMLFTVIDSDKIIEPIVEDKEIFPFLTERLF